MKDLTFLIIISIVALFISAIILAHLGETAHINDKDFCDQYQRSLNMRTTVDYLIVPALGETICNCTREDHPGEMYYFEYRCSRRPGL